MTEEMKNQLYDAILSIKDKETCKIFFEDLLTEQELDMLYQRVVSANMLLEGAKYSDVIAVTNVSSATLARVSKCVQYGEGYQRVLVPLLEKKVK